MRAWFFESLLSVTHQCGAACGAAREARMCGAHDAGEHSSCSVARLAMCLRSRSCRARHYLTLPLPEVRGVQLPAVQYVTFHGLLACLALSFALSACYVTVLLRVHRL